MKWITFRSAAGSEVTVRTGDIVGLCLHFKEGPLVYVGMGQMKEYKVSKDTFAKIKAAMVPTPSDLIKTT